MDFGDILGDGGFGEVDDENQDGSQYGQQDLLFGLSTQEMEEMKSLKDSVIFLIDCHKSMHQFNPHNGQDQQSNIQQVLRAAHSFVKTKIITNESDKISIILYGVAQNGNNKNQLNLNNIHVMCPLNEPDAGLIKLLETKMCTFSEDFGWFDDGAQTD